MKRSVFLIITLLIVCSGISAKRVSERDAFSIAEKFMPGKSIKVNPHLLSGSKSSPASKSYYIFNVEDNGGFVIVSGDDLTPSILGYSNSGNIDLTNIPGNLQWLLDSYDTQISSLTENSTLHYITRSQDREDIPVLVKVQWGQGEPYNNNCPTYEGSRCQTGCVATAMAQILQHHRWPQDELPSIPAYTTSSLGIDLDELPSVVFDWDSMDAVSIPKLMRYCGQAIMMDYTPWASGANIYEVPKALVEVFSFTRKASLEARGLYSDSEWDDLIYNELYEGRPVLYSGESSEAGAHTFIVDGYADGLYHLNWGWDGYCDGFFTLDALNPETEYGFTDRQSALISAYPADPEEEKNLPWIFAGYLKSIERIVYRDNNTEDFPSFQVEIGLDNKSGSSECIEFGIALYQDEKYLNILAASGEMYPNPYSSFSMSSDVNISSGISNGHYIIKEVFRKKGEDGWVPVGKSDEIYLDITISDDTLTIKPMPDLGFENDIIEYGCQTIDGIRYRLRADYGRYHAYPVALGNEMEYVGDLYIPDFVEYDGIIYKVSNLYGLSDYFLNGNVGVTSLSTPIAFELGDLFCVNKIEFRDGVIILPDIIGCPELESIDCASSVIKVRRIKSCAKLNMIKFNNECKISIYTPEDGIIWRDGLPSLSTIILQGDIPPSFINEDFGPEFEDLIEAQPLQEVTVHIPNGTLDVYSKYGWEGWNLIDDLPIANSFMRWNYCGEYDRTYTACVSLNPGCNIELGIRIPSEYLKPYLGRSITAIEYDAHYDTDYSEDVKYVFISSTDNEYKFKKHVNTVFDTRNHVDLDTPYVITGDDIFVGVGAKDFLGMEYANFDSEENGLWIRVFEDDGSDIVSWEKVVNYEINATCPVPIHVIIEGDNLPDDMMIVNANVVSRTNDRENTKLTQEFAPNKIKDTDIRNDVNGKLTIVHRSVDSFVQNVDRHKIARNTDGDTNSDRTCVQLKIRNRSPRIVRDFTLDWKLDGEEMAPLIISTSIPQNFNELVYVDLPDGLYGRNHSLEFNVKEIEGKTDTVTYNNTQTSSFSTQSSLYFPRKFVMEEATGTWCGFCPSGLATIERMKEHYPENFIAIGVHSDAEMSIIDDSYRPFFDKVSSFPSALLNRMQWVDLSPFSLDSELGNGVAMIIASASFAEGNCVDVVTETTFGFDDFGEDNYRIAYVVVEDKVGPYFQNNNYSDPEAIDDPDGYMNWWIHQKQMVTYVYDDVARSIVEYDGIGGFYPYNIEEGKEYRNSYKLVLPENIDNPEDLRIVTLLIDRATGEILNADSTGIEGEYNSVSAINKENDIRIRINENSLIIENAIGKDVIVNRIDGVSVALVRASSNYESLRLQEGVYLVNVGGEVSKVMIK